MEEPRPEVEVDMIVAVLSLDQLCRLLVPASDVPLMIKKLGIIINGTAVLYRYINSPLHD